MMRQTKQATQVTLCESYLTRKKTHGMSQSMFNSCQTHFLRICKGIFSHMLPLGAQLALIGSVFLLSACPASSEDVHPPKNQFFFPTGLTLSPDHNALFVANANSDLRYDSGTITLVDLDKVSELSQNWQDSGEAPAGLDCEVDKTFASVLICNESIVISEDSTMRIGNFATELGVQSLDNGNARIFAAVRGDPSLTWIDYDLNTKSVDCGGSGGAPKCDDAHRLHRMRGDESIGFLSPEPFGLYVDSEDGFVMLTHLAQAAVTLVDAPKDGKAPVISDALSGVFQVDSQTGIRAALGAAARTPGGRIYVTSRSEERVQVFSVARIGNTFPALVPAEYFFLRGVQPSDNSRGILFGSSGERAYIVNRSPPMLHVLDTSMDETGIPRNELLGAVELCSTASNLAIADMGEGERVFVVCFREGQVWSVDPATGLVDAIINVGRGPQALSISSIRKQLYVTNFLEDTMSVVELDPTSKRRNRVVLKLGRSRQSGGN